MLATQMSETALEVKNAKQIKEKLAHSLKALQKHYITSDDVVTSEDGDANLLCCALEAMFIHGIKSKYVRSGAGGRSRKLDRGTLPQPFFWSLLKTVTHREVITELEKISFLGTDVGRCRAWLRLALNHGLLECYLASLFREDSDIRTYYQPSALLLNEEEREVLLSYLQGLSSLRFNLSYKSTVLNEWTNTPLALAGMCPLSQADILFQISDGERQPNSTPKNKESWDTISQSSGSSDALEAQRGCPVLVCQPEKNGFHSSNLSLDTTGSSQLSSSLSSDSLLHGQDPRSPTGDHWYPADMDTPINTTISIKKQHKDVMADFQGSGQCSQDSMREDSFISSSAADQFSENATSSGSDSETQSNIKTSQDTDEQLPNTEPEPPLSSLDTPSDKERADNQLPNENCNNALSHLCSDIAALDLVSELFEDKKVGAPENMESVQEIKRTDQPEEQVQRNNSATQVQKGSHRSASIVSRKLSSDSLSHSHSWISDDDIYRPELEVLPDNDDTSPIAEQRESQSPPSVIHRRQIGLSNPFRGLLKLGHLERRGAVGIWRDYYCELSPFEFRMYLNAEERMCCENCSLLRCEDVRITSSDGRFEVIFPGKRLHLRAANRDEAEDWVDRIVEAVNKSRPTAQQDEHWEVLQTSENGPDECISPSSSATPSSPERHSSSADMIAGQEPCPPLQEFDWSQTFDLESDSIKEAVLYFSTDSKTWSPLVFSLSLEALKGFLVQEGRKALWITHPIEEIRDVVPDVALGGPAFFKVLTIKDTLRFRAENPEDARSWRALIRSALDSYLESGEDESSEKVTSALGAGVNGHLHRLVQHRLKENGVLLVNLYTVPSEKGLDAQGFKCAGCPQLIGPSRSRARLCEFTGQYYCDSCHRGDTTIIPSRMVHNWDLTKREVSKNAMRLLAQVELEPLLNLEQLNPELVKHSESMARAHSLRHQLRLLGDYLLTCRSGASKKIQAKLGQRVYLLESNHLYSVLDLKQIADGRYSTFLIAEVEHASNHVLHCDLCTQRGFICLICRSDDILFPFQVNSTTRCKDCKAVFHLSCQSTIHACPRCQRMKKYLERDLQD